MRWTVGAKFGMGFALALVLFVGVGGMTYYTLNELAESNHWVTHTYQVQEECDKLIAGLINAETGERGFVIANNESFLEPYHMGLKMVADAQREVRSLTADNAEQQRRLDQLDPMIRECTMLITEAIDTQRSQGTEAAHQWVASGKGKQQMDAIRAAVKEVRDTESQLLAARILEMDATMGNTRMTIIGGTLIALAALSIVAVVITRNICGRLRNITLVAKRIAAGDLSGEPVRDRSADEVSDLTAAFESMRRNLSEMTTQVRQATENVNSTAAEILASTQQQAASTKEQAATIQEITSTLEEINQSGGQISERASQVSASVESATTATQRGIKATQDTSQTMETIRDQVEEVAENVVSLSERTQTISEIIATVSEIAEQSNLLALNASIEAASAGEQGGRFSIVAHEMKNLADRAKECTVQVRTILSEIQKGINTSVMLTEEAVKRVDAGKQQAHSTESTIREVTETNTGSIQAFQQIVAGANQQQIGVTQVTQGMQDIRQAIKQTAASTSQLEKAAANMNALSQQLQRVVSQYQV